MTDRQHELVLAEIDAMARERQKALATDHPLVEEFFETVRYLESRGDYLNHSKNQELIAINLPEFYERARNKGQPVPETQTLKKALRTAQYRRFVDVKAVNSSIAEHDNTGSLPKTVHCWVFERPESDRD